MWCVAIAKLCGCSYLREVDVAWYYVGIYVVWDYDAVGGEPCDEG